MSPYLLIYVLVGTVVLITALPVLFECVRTVFNRQASGHNRITSALWIPIILACVVFWLPMLFFLLVTGVTDKQKYKMQDYEERRR